MLLFDVKEFTTTRIARFAAFFADGGGWARISLFFIALDGSLELLFMLLFMLLRFGLPLADMG